MESGTASRKAALGEPVMESAGNTPPWLGLQVLVWVPAFVLLSDGP